MKKIVIILGMHRSGTSLLSAGIAGLGVEFGDQLLPKNKENPKGFFENRAVVQLNERILERMGCSWDDPFLLFCKTPDYLYDLYQKEAVMLLKKHFAENSLFGLKDPRISLLLPFWQRVIQDTFGVTPYYSLIIRNPAEVAESLSVRQERRGEQVDNAKRKANLLLWFAYNYIVLKALQKQEEADISLTSFDNLISAPEHEIKKIQKFIGEACPEQTLKDFSNLFVEKKLRHHQKTLDEVDNEFPELGFVGELYEQIKPFCSQDVFEREDIEILLTSMLAYKDDISHAFQLLENELSNTGEKGKWGRGQRELSELKSKDGDKNTNLDKRAETHDQQITRKRERKGLVKIFCGVVKKLPILLSIESYIRKCVARQGRKRERALIKRSGLFDEAFYRKNFDEKDDIGDPVSHFLSKGVKESGWPNENFDPEYYLETYPEVWKNGLNPLVHYIKYGQNEGRRTMRYDKEVYEIGKRDSFDPIFYKKTYPDIGDIDPLYHYVKYGKKEGRLPFFKLDQNVEMKS